MVCPPSRGSCLPLSPLVSLLVSLCWMVCPPSRGLVSLYLPLSPHMCACVGWCVPLPKVLSPLVSHGLPTFVPVLDGVSAFPRFCLPCLLACLPACLPSCLLSCLPTCLSFCFPLWQVVSFCIFAQTVCG